MKKIILGIIASLFAGSLAMAFSPSVDGRAVVAEKDELPAGLFAKTIGYLPGDTISVTNLSKKTTVDILVVGSVESSEGIAILLSPEAAVALGMEKGGNNIVKITKRAGSFDEAIKGTAVIGDGIQEASDDASAEESESDSEKTEVSESSVEETAVPEKENDIPESSAEETTAENETIPENEKTLPEESIVVPPAEETEEVSPLVNEEENDAEVIQPSIEPSSDAYDKVQAEPFEEDALPENKAEAVTKPEESVIVVPEEKFSEPEKTESALESAPEVSEKEDEVQAEPYKEDELEDLPKEKSEPITETDELSPVESDELPEVDYVPAENTEKAADSEKVSGEPFSEETTEDESYEPIVLVPADTNPPENESEEPLIAVEDEEPESAAEKTEKSTEIEISEEPFVEIEIESEPEVVNNINKNVKASSGIKSASQTAKTSVNSPDISKHTVSSLKELKSGKYYIQIGAYSDKANIQEILRKYEKQYPVTLVPMANGKATQVMIGPLGVDEYGTVLQRFKSYGYKDAFLRKIR